MIPPVRVVFLRRTYSKDLGGLFQCQDDRKGGLSSLVSKIYSRRIETDMMLVPTKKTHICKHSLAWRLFSSSPVRIDEGWWWVKEGANGL